VLAALLAGLALASYGFWQARMDRDRALAAQAEQARERKRAQNSEAQARAEATKATTVAALLRQMLFAADPRAVKGPDFTVRQMLDDFSVNLGDQLASEPQVAAVIRSTIGNAYYGLGDYAKGLEHLQAALDLSL